MKPSEIARGFIEHPFALETDSEVMLARAYLRLREAADRVVGSMGEAWAILEKELEETDESGG